MFVTNHVLSGVVVGRLFERHPVAAFVVGVGSHLALDMVPHWGCGADRALDDELFLRYAKRDGLLGLATAACAVGAMHRRSRPAIAAAIAGAVLLDMDKPVLHFWGRCPVSQLGPTNSRRGPERVSAGPAERDRLRAVLRRGRHVHRPPESSRNSSAGDLDPGMSPLR